MSFGKWGHSRSRVWESVPYASFCVPALQALSTKPWAFLRLVGLAIYYFRSAIATTARAKQRLWEEQDMDYGTEVGKGQGMYVHTGWWLPSGSSWGRRRLQKQQDMDYSKKVSECPCAKPEQSTAAAAGPNRACGQSRGLATQRWVHSLHMVSPEAVDSAPHTQHWSRMVGLMRPLACVCSCRCAIAGCQAVFCIGCSSCKQVPMLPEQAACPLFKPSLWLETSLCHVARQAVSFRRSHMLTLLMCCSADP